MIRKKIAIIISIILIIGILISIISIVIKNKKSNIRVASANDNINDNNNNIIDNYNKQNNIFDTKSYDIPNEIDKNNNNEVNNNSNNINNIKEYSDPKKAKYVINALAIGDWGSTITKEGSCCNRRRKTDLNSKEYFIDYWAQINVADLLSQSAERMNPQPDLIIGHGDNFYWNGIGPKDVNSRFKNTFENVYRHKSLNNIKWINVMGNHDYGGDGYICGDQDNEFRPCSSSNELLESLENRFLLQSKYKSPNYNRWYMPGHYYKYELKNKDDTVTVDIYNVDTNIAASHGARQICCQCYGYSNGENLRCSDVSPGSKDCLNGNIEWYNACIKKIESWHDESIKNLEKDAMDSKADWKIVNSHYSPHYHFTPERQKVWQDILKKANVQVFMNGHTHSENHDYGNFGTHFFENGAGGGIQSEAPGVPAPHFTDIKNIWGGQNYPYGFFELHIAKDWMKVVFITFDDNWAFSKDLGTIVTGGMKEDHCWYIPQDGSIGKSCY